MRLAAHGKPPRSVCPLDGRVRAVKPVRALIGNHPADTFATQFRLSIFYFTQDLSAQRHLARPTLGKIAYWGKRLPENSLHNL